MSRISALLDEIRSRVQAGCPASREPAAKPRVISALAPGADQIAARAALLADDWQLHAILPFGLNDYTRIAQAALHQRQADAGAEAAMTQAQIGAATAAIAELAGKAAAVSSPEDWLPAGRAGDDHDDPDARYAALGRALVREADLLIAVWDGQAPRGPGGTGEVVADALARGVPVIRIDPAPPHPETSHLPRASAGLPASAAAIAESVRKLTTEGGAYARNA
ncbi:hypothetical protein [Alteraurantiacibacter palmitatis]|uniref:Uncharacterized protein n=1 Tax=Alteraurantiacibacter palmitatis TaxID=2054628 RepID=A0ABV7E8H2_9SPHN